MKQKMVIALTCCFIMLLGSGFAIGEDKPKVDLSKGEKIGFELPIINEVFNSAKSLGITKGFEERFDRTVSVEEPEKCKTDTCKVFQAGRAFAEIGYLIVSKEGGVPKGFLNDQKKVLNILNPPKTIKEKIEEISKKVDGGSLAGEKLRTELDNLAQEVFPEMWKDSDKDMVSRGMLGFSGGFFRLMYMGASSVAKKDKPDQKELGMFRYGGIVDYIVNFFTGEKAADSFKNSEEVKSLLKSLETIGPIVKKPEDKFTKQDVENIAKALEGQFKDQLKSN